MESNGQQVVGSDGGRGSYGGGREWCGVMEKGSSPGVVVARVRSSSPMPPRRCLCARVISRVRSRSWAVVFVHARSSSFTRSFVGACHRACRSRLVAVSMGGGAGHLWLVVVLGPRCHSWLVMWSRHCVVVGWCRCRRPWGGPLTVHGVGAQLICYPVCTLVLGLQTRLVRWGGDDDGWPLTFPSAPPCTWHRRSTCSLPCSHLRPLH